jgi:farnesyl diphosphate synthase
MPSQNPSNTKTDNSPAHRTGFFAQLPKLRERVEAHLDRWLPDETEDPERLHAAMRYSALAPGKRMRPLLVYASGLTLKAELEHLDGPACAVELIHAYSLVHDDLPPMDDDDLRRGRPTCHKAYDEATAILVGDALQTLAFEVLARDHAVIGDPARRVRMISLLAQSSGSRGMVGGQMIDILASGKRLERRALDQMHLLKTGALIRAAVLLGADSAPDVDELTLRRLETFGTRIGLAFQIQDDILDATGNSERLGKTAGADEVNDKSTYTAILGVDGAREALVQVYGEALAALEPLGENAEPLLALARLIIERDH